MEVKDDVFGPQLRGSFDFTLLFEQSILSILPSALFLSFSAGRFIILSRKEVRIGHGGLLWVKLVLSFYPSVCRTVDTDS